MLNLFRRQTPKIVLAACVCVPLLSVTVGRTAPEMVDKTVASQEVPPVEEEEPSIKDLGLYQSVYVEFAEVLSHYLPESDLDELIDLARFIVDQSHENSLNPYLVLAVIRVESTFNPCAVSKKGAKGLMQVIPSHILGRERMKREFAFSHHRFYDPYENIGMGVKYLASLVDRFGSVEDAITAYNLGPTRLSRKLRQAQGPISTRYTRRVIGQYRRYQGTLTRSVNL